MNTLPSNVEQLSAGPRPGPLWRVYVLRAGDGLSTAVAQYAVPVLTYQLTGSAAWAGAAFAAEWIPRLAALGIGGHVVDRLSPRAVMLAAAVIRATLAMAGVSALATGAGAGVVVAVGAGCGLVAQISYLAAESLGAAAGRGPNAARVQAVQTAIDQGALLTGPLIGGALLLTGPRFALGAVVAMSAMTTIAAVGVRMPRPGRGERTASGKRRGLRAGAAALRAVPALCWLTTVLSGMNLLAGTLQAAAPVIVGSFGRSPAATGAVWSVSAAVAMLAALVCARLLTRASVWTVIVTASLAAAGAAAAAGLATGYGQFIAAMAVLAAAEGAALVAMRTVRARLLPAAVFGSAVAVMVLVLLTPMPLGGLLLAAAGRERLPLLLLATALLHAVLTLAAAAMLRRHRHALDRTTGKDD